MPGQHFDHINDRFYFRSDSQNPMRSVTPGVYRYQADNYNKWLEPHPIACDGIIDPGDSVTTNLLRDIKRFFTKEIEAKYARYNFVYKRGILMHGLPGTGKSMTIKRLLDMAVAEGYICFLDLHPSHTYYVLKNIREICGPDQKFLVVWEELDDLLDSYENAVLQSLDGANQVPGVVYLATTNYIKRIPARVKARPSRFAVVVEVGPPSADVRRQFLQRKIHPEDIGQINLEEWVEKSEGLVLDQVGELVKSCLIFETDIDTAVAQLKRYPLDDSNDEDDD